MCYILYVYFHIRFTFLNIQILYMDKSLASYNTSHASLHVGEGERKISNDAAALQKKNTQTNERSLTDALALHCHSSASRWR